MDISNAMKRFKFYALLMPLAMGLASLSSCGGDEETGNDQQERGDVTSFNQVKYLQNNIIEIDSLGNMVQRVVGAKLNPADTTELTVGVKDVNEAKEMFESWLSPDTKLTSISPSTVDVQADLADGEGNVKETVYFKSASGDNIAEVTFKNGGVFKHFTKINFTNMWPLTDHSQYNIGDVVVCDTYDEGRGNWVCVRNAKLGVSGLLVYISYASGRWAWQNLKNFASPSLAKSVADMMKGNNFDTYKEYFLDAGLPLQKDDYYWIDDWGYYVFYFKIYAIRLSDGDIDWFGVLPFNEPFKHYLQVKTFGMEND